MLTRYFEIQKSLRHTMLCTNFCKSVNLTLVQGYVSMSLPYLPSLLEWLKFIHFNYSIKKIPKNLAMILAGPHFIINIFFFDQAIIKWSDIFRRRVEQVIERPTLSTRSRRGITIDHTG